MTEQLRSNQTPAAALTPEGQAIDWMFIVWLLIGLVTFTVAAFVAYRPSLDGPAAVAMAVLPWLTLAGIGAVFLADRFPGGARVKDLGTAVSLLGWSALVLADDEWSIMTFAIYAVCYSTYAHGPWVGIVLSGLTSAVWGLAWLLVGAPVWTTIIPIGVFVVGGLISITIHRTEELNGRQALLIEQLQQAQQRLATSERSKGVLEERARLASEIHDTLAQGFTSIILLSRAARRAGDGSDALNAIEDTAQENLDAARRLIDAVRPAELATASLVDAIDRHITTKMPEHIRTELRVVGEPRRLTGEVEVTLLRAAQEALQNVTTHAEAGQVDVTLSYLDDAVALDVRDDGVGFVPGTVRSRGSLTGGQGLQALEDRARSLAGRLTIEAETGGGSVVSVLLPAAPS